VFYADNDGDGFGNADAASAPACSAPANHVSNSSDCNDEQVNYTDVDMDGFGSDTKVACGGVTNTDDCDDAVVRYSDEDADGFGSDTKVACGGVTNTDDCNDAQLQYADGDSDTYGAGAPVACGVATNTDCNDGDATVFPGAAELCATTSVNNDCDGTVGEVDAEAADKVDYFRDQDLDGHSINVTARFCPDTTNAGYRSTLSSPVDCNDNPASGGAAIYPGAPELCGTVDVDNDCDLNAAEIDADASDRVQYYTDGDGDNATLATGALFCAGTTNAGYRASVSDAARLQRCRRDVVPRRPRALRLGRHRQRLRLERLRHRR